MDTLARFGWIALVVSPLACGGGAANSASAGYQPHAPTEDAGGGNLGPPTGEDAGGVSSAPPGGDASTGDAGESVGGGIDGGHADASAPPPATDSGTPPAVDAGLDPSVAPGGNFDLSLWELQEPVGSKGAPTTFSPAQLKGPTGHQDAYFFTDPTDGSMTFWDPEDGVTTKDSNYPRSELREMTASGAEANWMSSGTNTLSATLKATIIPDHVAVGQIHLGTGTPSSTKPLLELFYFATGEIKMAIEQTPAGGNEVQTLVGTVPMGTKWSYVIGLSGNTISFTLDGGAVQTFSMPSSFDQEGMYFKAGDYDQSVGSDGGVGAKVQFYALSIFHGP